MGNPHLIRNSSLLVNFNPRWSYICEKLSDDDFIGRQDTSSSEGSSDEVSDKVVEVLMIDKPSGPGLLFPKGGWENDETVEEASDYAMKWTVQAEDLLSLYYHGW
ncbi:Nudix hydrolase 16, mitochondrial, partial [Cucurbita argyrosperma subsp. sororia]